MEQAVEYRMPCTNCGSTVEASWGQEVGGDPGRVRWFVEWQCMSCGIVSDDGGDGPGSDALRRALIGEFGGCAISTQNPAARLAVVRRIREMFVMPPALWEDSEGSQVGRRCGAHGYRGLARSTAAAIAAVWAG